MPSEQATLERERALLSYVGSYERVSVVCAKEERTKTEMEKKTDENFMMQGTVLVRCVKYDSIADERISSKLMSEVRFAFPKSPPFMHGCLDFSVRNMHPETSCYMWLYGVSRESSHSESYNRII